MRFKKAIMILICLGACSAGLTFAGTSPGPAGEDAVFMPMDENVITASDMGGGDLNGGERLYLILGVALGGALFLFVMMAVSASR